MLDLLTPIIIESDNVSTQLLDIILIHIVEPQKTARKNAYGIAKELIVRTSSTLETYIQQVIYNSTIADKIENYLIICNFHCLLIVYIVIILRKLNSL